MPSFGLKLRKISLLTGDIALLYLSLLAALIIRYQSHFSFEVWQNHWPIFFWLFILWLIIFYAFNLYEITFEQNFFNLFNNFLPPLILNSFFSVVYFYLLGPKTNLAPKTLLVIFLLVFTVLFLSWRKMISRLKTFNKLHQNLIFIGYQPLVQSLLPKNDAAERFGFVFKGVILAKQALPLPLKLKTYPLAELAEIIKREKINLIVINEPENQTITEALFKILDRRINLISLTGFYELVNKRVPLEVINQGWFLSNFSEGNKKIFELSKRLLDLLIGLVCLTISLPFIPVIALAIGLNSHGPIIFKQQRVGKDGKLFWALKFRTMYQNAETSGPMWAKENDPRITKVGKFLRKIRLDEIPQLLNILKGDMSFVGPRPERPEFISQLEQGIPFYRERLLVKPGLTGWAQILGPAYGGSAEETLIKLQYDLYYIKNRSLFLDLAIILKTINVVFKMIGR